mgnify:CR=1 FL=1
MVEIPDDLQAVFSASVEEVDDRFVLTVPRSELVQGGVTPGETYRVALLAPATEGGNSTTSASDQKSTERPAESADDNHPDPPVAEGDQRTLTIESLGQQGDGIAKVERGYVVIVPNAEPGDTPYVEINEVRPNVAFASVIDAE